MHSENLQLISEISWQFETYHQMVQTQSTQLEIHCSNFLWQETSLELAEEIFEFKP